MKSNRLVPKHYIEPGEDDIVVQRDTGCVRIHAVEPARSIRVSYRRYGHAEWDRTTEVTMHIAPKRLAEAVARIVWEALTTEEGRLDAAIPHRVFDTPRTQITFRYDDWVKQFD